MYWIDIFTMPLQYVISVIDNISYTFPKYIILMD